jgi:hypothetical protein
MEDIQEWTINAKGVKSLAWQDGKLIDWAGGGIVYHLDGTIEPSHVGYAYRFDAAVVSPSGEFAVIYEKLGTKALVLKQGKILRELDRSFYYAHAYEYPVTLFRLPDGRELIAHCPEGYCRIDIDDLATGQRLTNTPTRKPFGPFFSRLAANLDGTLLLSAGWVWQPFNVMQVYELSAVLEDPHLLDTWGIGPQTSDEVSSAAFSGKDRLIRTSSLETFDDETETTEWLPSTLTVYDFSEKRNLSTVQVDGPIGTVMPVGSSLVIGFYEHPRLIDVFSGKVIYRWPGLNSGKQTSSIIWGIDSVPPLALDPVNGRFAIADDNAIHIVEVSPEFRPSTP